MGPFSEWPANGSSGHEWLMGHVGNSHLINFSFFISFPKEANLF
jgi:hypothetical protein